mmetsp:Transcript_31658/g.64338  ORF Transcript_31658/g.64338 Transcript_31658/m.64338 type:complete len:237 (+) Transcript_31658:282-992(+)
MAITLSSSNESRRKTTVWLRTTVKKEEEEGAQTISREEVLVLAKKEEGLGGQIRQRRARAALTGRAFRPCSLAAVVVRTTPTLLKCRPKRRGRHATATMLRSLAVVVKGGRLLKARRGKAARGKRRRRRKRKGRRRRAAVGAAATRATGAAGVPTERAGILLRGKTLSSPRRTKRRRTRAACRGSRRRRIFWTLSPSLPCTLPTTTTPTTTTTLTVVVVVEAHGPRRVRPSRRHAA